MPKNKWDDEDIENLLRDFPAIKDERPKEEVYKRLKQEQQKPKKPNRWIPYLIAALAFIAFGVLLASMLGQNSNDSASHMSGSDATEENAEMNSTAVEESEGEEAGSAEMESSETADSAGESEAFNTMENREASGALSIYGDELEGLTLFTIGLTENALVIPVTFSIPDARIMEDFGRLDVNEVDLYNRYAAEIDEEGLGFDNYHPFSGTIEKSESGIVHRVPQDHAYDMASAALTVYMNSLAATFAAADEITVSEETGEPANFDQVGPVEPFDPAVSRLAYYSYQTSAGDTYLVPGYDMPFDDATDAFGAMKSSTSDLYISLIPEGLEYTVTETGETVEVNFEEAVDFNQFEREQAVRMIEGMALTADSFGKTLVLTNTAEASWEGFDFSEPLRVPAGINLKNLEQ